MTGSKSSIGKGTSKCRTLCLFLVYEHFGVKGKPALSFPFSRSCLHSHECLVLNIPLFFSSDYCIGNASAYRTLLLVCSALFGALRI